MTAHASGHRPSIWWSVLSGLTILAGILAIAAPMAAGLATTLLVGWFVTFAAVTHLWLTFEPQRLASRLWHVLAAAIYGIGGAYLMLRPDVGLLSLTLFLSAMLFASGIVRVAAYFSLKDREGAIWLLADGILTVLLGTLIYLGWPASSHWAVGTLVGVALIFNGVANLMFSQSCRRHARQEGGDIEGHVVV
jgi:uncharacterized membrane protein HdeD (DUF308 family)